MPIRLAFPDCAPRGEALPVSRRRPRLGSLRGETPADHAERPRAAGGAPHAESRRLPRDLLTGLRVLVVDDDIPTVEYFAAALGRCGARVLTVFSAPEALQALEEATVDVVLTDIAMPGGDGYWMLGEIRTRLVGRGGHPPVVAATAYGREHSRERALAAGFAEHLGKPVAPEVLCRTIARAAGRG